MPLTFREKIELARMIDLLKVDAIELPPIENQKVDPLLIKSISAAARHAEIAVPVKLNGESVEITWNALRDAVSARLQVVVPVSSVQMEYLFHMKPKALKEKVIETVLACRKYTDRVELIAEDATRSDGPFLTELLTAAVEAGVTMITLQEAAGTSLPEEMRTEIGRIISSLPDRKGVVFGVDCSNALSLADACAVETVHCGVREIKAASFPLQCANLANVVRILSLKGEKLGVYCTIRQEEIRRITSRIESLCRTQLSMPIAISQESAAANEAVLSYHDSKDSVLRAIEQLGYFLSEDDQDNIYQAFLKITEKKESITLKELEALVAAEAMQVPAAYQIVHFIVNTSNDIGAMAHVRIQYHDQSLEGVSTGDGVIDAAFLALEKAAGRHFELDEFQIQAITEGKEAVGEAMVKLRSQGKLYPGRGISTDIVGASIVAYINALNRIVYEEEDE